jgi:hypothetical protein
MNNVTLLLWLGITAFPVIILHDTVCECWPADSTVGVANVKFQTSPILYFSLLRKRTKSEQEP